MSADEIKKLADLESREVLLAKLAGAMKASLSSAVALFAAPLSQTARVVDALRAKAEQDPSVLPAEPVRRHPPTPRPLQDEAAADDATEPSRGTVAEAVATEQPTADHRGLTSPIEPTTATMALPGQLTTEGTPPWRSSAPTSCSTRSRR